MLISPATLIKKSLRVYASHSREMLPYLGLLLVPSLVSLLFAFLGPSFQDLIGQGVSTLLSIILGIAGLALLAAVILCNLWVGLGLQRALYMLVTGAAIAPLFALPVLILYTELTNHPLAQPVHPANIST